MNVVVHDHSGEEVAASSVVAEQYFVDGGPLARHQNGLSRTKPPGYMDHTPWDLEVGKRTTRVVEAHDALWGRELGSSSSLSAAGGAFLRTAA